MSADLVRAVIRRSVGVEHVTVGRTDAEARGLPIVDEPTHLPGGKVRPPTRPNGRRSKPKTTVAKEAAAKKAARDESAANQQPAF